MRSVCTSFSRSGGPVNQGLAASRGHAVVAVGPAHGHAPIRMGRALSGATAGMRSKAEERNHRGVQPLRALDLSAVPQEAIIAGGAVAVSLLGLLGYQMSQSPESADGVTPQPAATPAAPAEPPLPRENAVMVLGATGRVGRRVVRALLQSGRTVVAAVRSEEKALKVYEEVGVQPGKQKDGKGILFINAGVDVTRQETLDRADLWSGVTQVVSLLGSVFGPQPDGSMGFIDGMSPERVEAGGSAALAAVLPKHLKKAQMVVKDVLPMVTEEDLAKWERMDDVIMGGISSSSFELLEDGGVKGATWKGDLIMDGGGFCGCRTVRIDTNLSGTDGLALRVRGNGSTFKLNIKTQEQLDSPESTYQATFDTVAGQWTNIMLPWHNFVPVKRAQSDPKGLPLDPSNIAKFGLVLSRFEFNGMPNPKFTPGTWKLDIDGGVRAYTEPRPQLVMISSAGVERNAIIGDDEEARKADIPIVQLNPGGTLNYKYQAECTLRASGYPYTVVRSTGMIDSTEGGPFLLEADQGDSISGYMGRDEVADVLVSALCMPEAANKTFEVRRYEADDAKRILAGGSMSRAQYLRMYLRLADDAHRWRVGLRPMPRPVPPPSPPSEDRTKAIVEQVAAVREKAASKDAPKKEAAKKETVAKEPVTADA